MNANLTHRVTWFGAESAPARAGQRRAVNGVRQYRDFGRSAMPWLEKKLHFTTASSFAAAGSPARRRCSSRSRSTSRSIATTRCSRPLGRDRSSPFTGRAAFRNDDYVVDAQHAPVLQVLRQHLLPVGTRRKLLRVVAGDICSRPTRRLAAERQDSRQPAVAAAALRSAERRDAGGDGRIPRLKVEYQLSRAVFLRAIGKYNAQRQDTLRDDSRTNLPIADPRSSDRRLRAARSPRNATAFGSTRCSPTSRRPELCSSRATAAFSRNRRGSISGTFNVQTTVFFSRRVTSSGFDAGQRLAISPPRERHLMRCRMRALASIWVLAAACASACSSTQTS